MLIIFRTKPIQQTKKSANQKSINIRNTTQKGIDWQIFFDPYTS